MIKLAITVRREGGNEKTIDAGLVTSVPSVGDWVDREDSGWRGTVLRRWWFFGADGHVECRVLISDDSTP